MLQVGVLRSSEVFRDLSYTSSPDPPPTGPFPPAGQPNESSPARSLGLTSCRTCHSVFSQCHAGFTCPGSTCPSPARGLLPLPLTGAQPGASDMETQLLVKGSSQAEPQVRDHGSLQSQCPERTGVRGVWLPPMPGPWPPDAVSRVSGQAAAGRERMR